MVATLEQSGVAQALTDDFWGISACSVGFSASTISFKFCLLQI
jgi:hypothetical protein